MFLCLIQKPHPVRRPPLCRRGAGGEAVPQERENQINTLVLKDINFTINIIELSYYRTIDTLNQSKNAPVVKADTKESLPKPLFIFAVKEKEQKFSLSSINFYLCCCKEKLTARGIN